jgi:trimeric autotransporter adhesin
VPRPPSKNEAFLNDGTTQDLTNQVSWTSTNVNVATIKTSGVANSVSPGTVTVMANMLGVNATALLTVF